jgi:hypothetical protein
LVTDFSRCSQGEIELRVRWLQARAPRLGPIVTGDFDHFLP